MIKKKIRSCAMWAVAMMTTGAWFLSDYAMGPGWLNDIMAAAAFSAAGAWMMLGWSHQSTLDAVVRVEQSIDALREMLEEQRKEEDETTDFFVTPVTNPWGYPNQPKQNRSNTYE